MIFYAGMYGYLKNLDIMNIMRKIASAARNRLAGKN